MGQRHLEFVQSIILFPTLLSFFEVHLDMVYDYYYRFFQHHVLYIVVFDRVTWFTFFLSF